MRHVEIALNKYNDLQYPNIPTTFIEVENLEDVKGVAPIVKFTIQSDPISEVGVSVIFSSSCHWTQAICKISWLSESIYR